MYGRLMRDGLQMFAQEIAAEVAVEVAPDGMDVVAVVLGIVELDEKRRALHPVIVLLTAFEIARPGEGDFVETGRFELSHSLRRDVARPASPKWLCSTACRRSKRSTSPGRAPSTRHPGRWPWRSARSARADSRGP